MEEYKNYTQNLSARTLEVDSFWAEEVKMLSEFPEIFQSSGCIPERKYLKCLTKWKWAGLWANHAKENSREKLRRTTRRVFEISERAEKPSDSAVQKQVKTLDEELKGVSAATATVLLTFWRPEVYTVMDVKALSSLTNTGFWEGKSEASISEYPEYLRACHRISDETGLNLRDVDRALWSMAD